MFQTVNLPGFVSSIDIELDEFMLPLQEVVVNAIQSIEDRTEGENTISIKVLRDKQITLKGEGFDIPYKPITGFEVTDSGIGFISKRYNAFNVMFTDINRKKGCKGIGRYTVLACFGSMEIDSTFLENGKLMSRVFSFDSIKGIFPDGDGNLSEIEKGNQRTIVRLLNYKKEFYDNIVANQISLGDIAENIIHHCLLYFTANQIPLIRLYDEDEPENALIVNDLYKHIIKFDKEVQAIKIEGVEDDFTMNYIRNNTNRVHAVHLCANKREVGKKIALTTYIPSFVNALQDGDEKYFLSIYITSDFLDKKVNNQRTKFLLPVKEEDKKTFDTICLNELFQHISEKVKKEYEGVIEAVEEEKNQRIRDYILDEKKPRLVYRHLLNIDGVFDDIPANATDERIESELHKKVFSLEQKRTKAFDKAFAKKKYDKDEFSEIIHSVLKEEAAFSADKLADLMIRRKCVIKLFSKYLEWRKEDKYMLEEDLHNIIFTMGAETNQMPQDYHNLWLLDERLTFHHYATSDRPLKTNPHIGSESKKETDMLIYDFPWAYTDNPNNVNSLVIFEFKRPGRDMNTSKDRKLDSQVEEYFEKLMESKAVNNKGRYMNIQDTTPKFGYIICDLHSELVDYNVKHNYFKQTPYGTLYKINPDLNMYFEVMSYETMLDFAEKRHDSFFRALGIDNL